MMTSLIQTSQVDRLKQFPALIVYLSPALHLPALANLISGFAG